MSDKHSFCDNCGSPIASGNRFCDNCGKAVGEAPSPPQPQHTGGYTPPPEKTSSATGKIISLIIFLVIVAIVVAVFVISGGDDDDDDIGFADRSTYISNTDNGRSISINPDEPNRSSGSDQECDGEAEFRVSNLYIRQNSREIFDVTVDIKNIGDCRGVYKPSSKIDGESHGDEAGVALDPGESASHSLIMAGTRLDILYLEDMYEDQPHSDHRVCVDSLCQTVRGADYN